MNIAYGKTYIQMFLFGRKSQIITPIFPDFIFIIIAHTNWKRLNNSMERNETWFQLNG